MSDSGPCQRCKLPIIGTRYSFRVDADPPIPSADPAEISICTACLASMQRWMERRHARGESAVPEGGEAAAPASSRSKKEKKRKNHHKSRSRYDHQLLRSERWNRIRAWLTISVVVVAFTVLFVLIAVEISTYSRGGGNSIRPNLPVSPVPTVDPVPPQPLK